MKLQNNIKKYRLEKNLTQQQLADMCNLTKNSISSYERNEYTPCIIPLLKLCNALNVKVEDLYYFEEE